MSFQAMTWAVEQNLPTNQKMVLLMLANRTNHDTGRCDPSHKRLAEDCGMGISTLKRALAGLEQAGFIEVIQRKDGDVNLPNQYILKMNGVGSERTNPPSKLAQPLAQIGLTHSPNRAEGVGPDRATNQEYNNQEVNQEDNQLLSANATQGQAMELPGIEKPEKQKAKRATQLPDDFVPTEQHIKLAADLGVSLPAEWPQFCDYHRAKGSKFVDWSSALRTWIRNANKFSKSKPQQNKPGYFKSNGPVDYSAGVKPDGSF